MQLILILLSVWQVHAANCSSPPQPSGGRVSGAWWSQYSSWCSACGGTPYQDSSGGGCRPGPNWGGGSGGSSGSAGGAISTGNVGQDIMLNVMQAGITELFREPTPAEKEAKRQRDFELEQQRIAAEAEARRIEKEKNDRMDGQADATLGLLDMSASPQKVSDDDLLKDIKANFLPKEMCVEGSKQFICHVPTCGGGVNLPAICCPEGYPILNECDCHCYPAGAQFECKRYAACQYTYETPKTKTK